MASIAPRDGRFSYAGWATLKVDPVLASSEPEDVLADIVEEALHGLHQDGILARRLRRMLRVLEALEVVSEPEFKAPPGVIEAWEDRAGDGPFFPTVSLRRFWLVRSPGLAADALASRLALLHPAIRTARPVTRCVPATVQPADDLLSPTQRHHFPAPEGIDARWAWANSHCDGTGVGFADIEPGWIPHTDLPTYHERFPLSWTPTTARWHGAAVLGVVCALDDDKLVLGVAPECDEPLVYAADSTARVAQALERVLLDMDVATSPVQGLSPFDVVLLEAEDVLGRIMEYHDDVRAAIRLCVSRDVIVVECAGNGSLDLDSLLPGGGVGMSDSGALVVAASDPATGHTRWTAAGGQGSNHGARTDCFAPGLGVVTTDGSDPAGAKTDFGGTSAAGAIIAGAAVLVQHMAETALGHRLGPTAMRDLLRDPALGTPCSGPDDIGVMPDLRRVWKVGLAQAPALLVRDHVGDTGSEPSAGTLAASPDIYVVPHGTPAAWPADVVPPARVEPGTDHQVFVRVRNVGGGAPAGLSASVHWSPPATLVHPGLWTPIGTTTRAGGLASTDGLVTLPPIVWADADLPGEGHYCFVGIVDHPDDPAPVVPDFASSAGTGGGDAVTSWKDFVRDHRNVTWRNFNVVDPPDAEALLARFLMTALPDVSRVYQLIVVSDDMPEGVDVEIHVPSSLRWRWTPPAMHPVLRMAEGDGDTAVLRTRGGGGSLGSFRLEPDARHGCGIALVGWPEKGVPDDSTPEFAVVQLLEGTEMGRVTWRLRPAPRPSSRG